MKFFQDIVIKQKRIKMTPINFTERSLIRVLEAVFSKTKRRSVITVIRKGDKPNTYVLDDNYFSAGDTITDGWQKIKILKDSDACPSNEQYRSYWIYTFDQELQEPINNCELWKITTNLE